MNFRHFVQRSMVPSVLPTPTISGGDIHYNPTIAIPPGSLSTISWPYNLLQLAEYPPHTGAYDPAACRTYAVDSGTTVSWTNGLSSWTTSTMWEHHKTQSCFRPNGLTALGPQWEACTAWNAIMRTALTMFSTGWMIHLVR